MMIRRLAVVRACIRCEGEMTDDDRDHYGRQCHACVMREHEVALLLGREPDHPDLDWFEASPVDLGRRVPLRRAKAA